MEILLKVSAIRGHTEFYGSSCSTLALFFFFFFELTFSCLYVVDPLYVGCLICMSGA